MKKLLLTTAAALALAVSGGAANATVTFTIWSGAGLPTSAIFPLPTTDLLGSFTSTDETLNFRNSNPEGGSNTFNDFFGAYPGAAAFLAAHGTTTMSTLGDGDTTFISITETYTSPAITSTLDHDDGAAIYIDGAGNGAQICGNPLEASENTQTCDYAAGTHTLDLLYTEDNGAPAILVTDLPPESTVPEPTSMALLGTGLIGLALARRRRRKIG